MFCSRKIKKYVDFGKKNTIFIKYKKIKQRFFYKNPN